MYERLEETPSLLDIILDFLYTGFLLIAGSIGVIFYALVIVAILYAIYCKVVGKK